MSPGNIQDHRGEHGRQSHCHPKPVRQAEGRCWGLVQVLGLTAARPRAVLLVHHAVPHIQAPGCPATEPGHPETTPLQVVLPKYQVKLPFVCKVNRETVLKTSPYKTRKSYFSFVVVFMTLRAHGMFCLFFYPGIVHFSTSFLSKQSWSKPTTSNPI